MSFLRRFLLHLLPKGFVRIRNFGLLAIADVPPPCTLLSVARSAPQAKAEHPSPAPVMLGLPQMWWTDAAHRKVYSCGAPAPFSADPGGRRRMNVDRHYETFAYFCSLTLLVSPANPIPFSHSQGHPRRTTFEFFRNSYVLTSGAVLFRVSPRTSPNLLFLN